jgi:hypothetical protein
MSEGQYAYDDDGRLYEPQMRAALAGALPTDRLAEYEALLALRRAAFVLERQTRTVRNIAVQEDPAMRTLMRLHGEPAGVPVDELVAERGEEVRTVIDGLDQEGMLIRSGASVRLSDLGVSRMDEAIRRVADELAALLGGVSPEDLAALRHVSLQLILNHVQLHPTTLPGQ